MVARRSVRKRTAEVIMAINAMTGETLGRIGNLSVDGMMLISSHSMREEQLFQVQFQLRDAQRVIHRFEVGIQCLWCDEARTEHTYWTGAKLIDISDAEQEVLDAWVERALETVP